MSERSASGSGSVSQRQAGVAWPGPEDSDPPLAAQVLRWWALARRRPAVPVAVALVAAAGMWLHRSRQPAIFEAEGMVQMGMNTGMSMDPGEYVLWVAGRERTMHTQEQLLTSDPVVESAIRSLGRELPGGSGRRAALRDFLGGVSVTPLEDTYLVRVVARNPDPAEAARRVNALMDAFIPFTNQFMVSRYVLMERQLEDEMERLRRGLAEAEQQLHAFYAESGNLQFDQRRHSLQQRQQELDLRLTALRIQRASLEAEREMLARGLEAPLAQEGLELLLAGLSGGGGGLQARLEPLARLRAQLVRVRTELKPDHPEVALLEQQVIAHERALRELAAATLASLRMREEVAAKEEEKLSQLLAELQEEVVRLDHLDGIHRTRKREVERYDRELDAVRQRHLRAESRSSMDAGATVVLSRAEPPGHPLPQRALSYVLLACALGLALGVALLIAWDYLEDAVSSDEQVRALGLPVLGRVPQLDRAECERVVLKGSRGRAAEAFRDVRTYLAATPRAQGAVLVSSGGPGVGKTFVSLNLAAALTRAGARTLLVDGDMRRPRLQEALGTSYERGLSDLLQGDEAPLESLVQRTELEGLWFLPSGPRPGNSSDLLATDRFQEFVRQALERYDQVVIDTPPVDLVSDASLMARHVSGCVLVVRLHRSRQRAAKRAIEQIEAVGGTCLGVVVNGFTRLDEGYGYGSYGRYAYAYHASGDAQAPDA